MGKRGTFDLGLNPVGGLKSKSRDQEGRHEFDIPLSEKAARAVSAQQDVDYAPALTEPTDYTTATDYLHDGMRGS